MAGNCGNNGCELPFLDVSKTIKCAGFCGRTFHISCTSVTRNVETILNTAKNVLWFCDPCMHIHKNGFEKISALYNEILKSREHNKVLLNDFYTKITNSINIQSKQINEVKNEMLCKNDELKSSYAEIVKNNNVKIKKKTDSVVIIKPKDKSQNVNKTKDDVKNSINPNEIPVNGLSQVNDGGVVIRCKNKEDIGKIKEIVENTMSEKYEARIPEIKNPRIKIIGIDNKPADNSEIIETIMRQNSEFFDTDGDIKNVITVIEINNNKKYKYFNVILEISPKSFNKIMTVENIKMNYNWNRCKVFEAIHIKRCFKCGSLDGHVSKECKKDVLCYKCGENHTSDNCKNNTLKCINCVDYNKRLNLNLDTNHNVLSNECKVYQRLIEMRKRAINYNE
jgi:hypothetical protein